MIGFPERDAFLFVDNTGFPNDPDFPYLVVTVSNEPVGKFVSKQSAYLFVTTVLECWGRIIDTRT